MSTQVDQAIVEAANGVHGTVWKEHWRKGETVLRADQITTYIRTVRVNAACTEEQLPTTLRGLLAQARTEKIGTIPLSKLLEALRGIVLAAA